MCASVIKTFRYAKNGRMPTIFLKENLFLDPIMHRIAQTVWLRHQVEAYIEVACIIVNNQQVNRANSIDSAVECHNSLMPKQRL